MNFIQGDITKETSGLIIHGVNAQGVMGSGVALAIKTKWPEIYTAYKSHKQGKAAMGKIQVVSISDGLYVANCWTQEFFGKDGAVYGDMESVRKILIQAFWFCEDYGIELKAPKIGCGLAGLSWEKQVKPVFDELLRHHPDVKVTIFEIN